ncbi:hypothetical protein ACHAWF_015510 [Thalassiosira exigua]
MNFNSAITYLLSNYRGDVPNVKESVHASSGFRDNPCYGSAAAGLQALGRTQDIPCSEAIEQQHGQTGADVTEGYVGGLDVGDAEPYTQPFSTIDFMCVVNVHWHLGAEHRSEGEYDEDVGKGPVEKYDYPEYAYDGQGYSESGVPGGLRCGLYDAEDPKFTKPYGWKHCDSMQVGETYEIHWPHSSLGDCGAKYQYQTPFPDGVFCHLNKFDADQPISNQVGVQAQVFTVVNDDSGDYYWDDLIDGMVVDEDRGMGVHVTKYTGSTTGPNFNNDERCDDVTPISWHVDRKCHLISASAFDKLSADMKQNPGMKNCGDDCKGNASKDENGCCFLDVTPIGSREVVADELAANNQVNRFLRNSN